MTTSRKKIEGYKLENIAELVASKAFAHIMTPLEEERRARAEAAYQAELKARGLTSELLENAVQMLGSSGKHYLCQVRVYDTQESVSIGFKGNWSSMSDEDRALVPTFPVGYVCISSKEVQEAFIAEDAKYQEVRKQMYDLKNELRSELYGKTAAQACKAWPEVADIICSQLGIGIEHSTNAPMTTPLSQLLSKYLTALPAPAAVQQGEEVAA